MTGESGQYPIAGGSKSRNKVAVGEPAAGSFSYTQPCLPGFSTARRVPRLPRELQSWSLYCDDSMGRGRVQKRGGRNLEVVSLVRRTTSRGWLSGQNAHTAQGGDDLVFILRGLHESVPGEAGAWRTPGGGEHGGVAPHRSGALASPALPPEKELREATS